MDSIMVESSFFMLKESIFFHKKKNKNMKLPHRREKARLGKTDPTHTRTEARTQINPTHADIDIAK